MSDLHRALSEQIELLIADCDAYDMGRTLAAKRISVALRTLFHETKASRSLLTQVKQRSGFFFDTAKTGPAKQSVALFGSSLTTIELAVGVPGGTRFSPVLINHKPLLRKSSFSSWWNAPIIWDEQRRTFNRRQIILQVANTDGGAHIDPTLDPKYADLTRGIGSGVFVGADGWSFQVMRASAEEPQIGEALKGLELAVLRQISHEVIETLQARGLCTEHDYKHGMRRQKAREA